MSVLYWPSGEPKSRMKSRGGLVSYTIVRAGESAYRWAAAGRQWSATVYASLGEAKSAAEADYFRVVQRAALALKADGKHVY